MQTWPFVTFPWKRDNHALPDLHFKSLNISPPLVLNNSTLQSLDKTYRILDDRLDSQLATLQHDVANVRFTPHRRTLPDLCPYVSFSLTIANTIALIVFCCRSRKRLLNQSLSWFPFSRSRRLPKSPSDGDRSDQVIEETELATLPRRLRTTLVLALVNHVQNIPRFYDLVTGVPLFAS